MRLQRNQPAGRPRTVIIRVRASINSHEDYSLVLRTKMQEVFARLIIRDGFLCTLLVQRRDISRARALASRYTPEFAFAYFFLPFPAVACVGLCDVIKRHENSIATRDKHCRVWVAGFPTLIPHFSLASHTHYNYIFLLIVRHFRLNCLS